MPPEPQCHLGVRHDPPRLGQVEHDPVEVPLVDPLVDVAHLDPVASVVTDQAATLVLARSAKSSRSS